MENLSTKWEKTLWVGIPSIFGRWNRKWLILGGYFWPHLIDSVQVDVQSSWLSDGLCMKIFFSFRLSHNSKDQASLFALLSPFLIWYWDYSCCRKSPVWQNHGTIPGCFGGNTGENIETQSCGLKLEHYMNDIFWQTEIIRREMKGTAGDEGANPFIHFVCVAVGLILGETFWKIEDVTVAQFVLVVNHK